MSAMTPDLADHAARVFVNGMVDEIKQGERTGRKVLHTAHWSSTFADHPWVQASEAEGWGRELRSAVVAAVKRRIMFGEPHHDIDQLMPSSEWVAYVREKARREKEAAAWRAERFLSSSATKSNEPRPLGSATREAFQNMQTSSREQRLHLKPLAELANVSNSMKKGAA